MKTDLKEILAKVQKIQIDLLEIRTMFVSTSFHKINEEEVISIDVTLFDPYASFTFGSFMRKNENEDNYIRLLNYLNAEDFAELHKELDSEMVQAKEHWCDDCTDDCDKCIKTKAQIVTKEDF